MIPENIERTHIEKAIAEIDQNGIQKGAQSSTYDLIKNGKRYPPKLVLSLANKYANGQELDRSTFYGGENTKAFKFLRNYGFQIEEKTSIKKLVNEFLEQSKTSQLTTTQYPKKYKGLKVKVSFGAGNVARIPWIGFLKSPNKISKGIYPSLLLFKEVNCLVLAYGSSETNESVFTWNLDDEEEISQWYQRKFNKKPARYGGSRIKTVFHLNEGVDYERLKNDLDDMIDRYKRIAFDKVELNEPSKKFAGQSGNQKPVNKFSAYPLNSILYGPPGTGKTYKSKEIAVQIANPSFTLSGDLRQVQKREKIVEEYDRLFKSGQIVFTTFHQSFSYEDFIEGIKPLPPKPDGDVGYEVQDGIFKRLCNKAKEKKQSVNFDEAYTQFINEVIEKGDLELHTPFYKKPFKVRINSNESAVAIPQTETKTEMSITKEMLRNYILTGEIKDWKPYTTSIAAYLKDNYNVEVQESSNETKNYVLIIDEINRGNVSSILGELITLLEPDKRQGMEEELSVELPYSKVSFTVPSNLYVIGTMNTADRSVEALDTALRRRFDFEEVMPNSDLLREIYFEGFNLKEVLDTINERIEALLDRDHTIGHSYFIKIPNGDIEALQEAFENKIIPLLQEYFYHDYEKIALILGEGFIERKDAKISFAKFSKIDLPDVLPSYHLKEVKDIEEAIYTLLNRSNEAEE